LRLAGTPFYRLMLAAQLAFYGVALGGYVAGGARRRLGVLSVPYVFCLLNAAIVVGLARFVSGRQQVTWDNASGRWTAPTRAGVPHASWSSSVKRWRGGADGP